MAGRIRLLATVAGALAAGLLLTSCGKTQPQGEAAAAVEGSEEVRLAACLTYFTSISSTRKCSVALGGTAAPAPRAP